MNKLMLKANQLKNKKGFTLIEMLVVIAIIAVLVAIIIPTVTSATGKSKAATDAANLRSAKAVITVGLLDGSLQVKNNKVVKTADSSEIDADYCGIPATAKSDGTAFAVSATGGNDGAADYKVTVKYGDSTIADFAAKAGNTDTQTTAANADNQE